MINFRTVTNHSEAKSGSGLGVRHSAPGFTLIEICIAMGLCMLILGIGALSITGMQDQAKLKKTASEIELTARKALQEAVMKQRQIELALQGLLGAEGGRVQVKRVGEKAFRNLRRGETWEFSPTGICEPLEVRVTSPAGVIELAFDPLTGCAVKKNVSVNS